HRGRSAKAAASGHSRSKCMNSKLLFAALSATAAAASPVVAAGIRQSGATVGDCISDGFYGNEPNMADGSAGGPAEQAPGTKARDVLANPVSRPVLQKTAR